MTPRASAGRAPASAGDGSEASRLVRPSSADGTLEQRRVDLAGSETAIARAPQQAPAVGDDLASEDRGHRPAGHLPALPGAVIAHVEVLARQRLVDRGVDEHEVGVTAGSDRTLAGIEPEDTCR